MAHLEALSHICLHSTEKQHTYVYVVLMYYCVISIVHHCIGTFQRKGVKAVPRAIVGCILQLKRLFAQVACDLGYGTLFNKIIPFFSIPGGELFDRVIEDEFVLTEKSCICFMRQVLEGVSFMHSKNILHLDLKVS